MPLPSAAVSLRRPWFPAASAAVPACSGVNVCGEGTADKLRGEHFHELGDNSFKQLETLKWVFGMVLVAEDDSPQTHMN